MIREFKCLFEFLTGILNVSKVSNSRNHTPHVLTLFNLNLVSVNIASLIDELLTFMIKSTEGIEKILICFIVTFQQIHVKNVLKKGRYIKFVTAYSIVLIN